METSSPASLSSPSAIAAGGSRLAMAMVSGLPSFIRRARALEEALAALRERIAAERAERLRALLGPARGLEASRARGAALPTAALEILDLLRALPGFDRRSAPAAANPARALRALTAGARRFNERWLRYLETIPIDAVRGLQAAYNRYYPIEREAALPGAPAVPFTPVRLLERADLAAIFPPLPEPGDPP